jgi:hypothetical protein
VTSWLSCSDSAAEEATKTVWHTPRLCPLQFVPRCQPLARRRVDPGAEHASECAPGTERKHFAQVRVGPNATVSQPPSLLARRGAGANLKREARQRSKPLVLRYVRHQPARPYVSADRGFRIVGAILSRHKIVLCPNRGISVEGYGAGHECKCWSQVTLIQGAGPAAGLGRADWDEPGFGQHLLGCDVVMGGRCSERAQPVLRGREPT